MPNGTRTEGYLRGRRRKSMRIKKLEVAEMRCLRAIRGVTRRERMRNEDIRHAGSEGGGIERED